LQFRNRLLALLNQEDLSLLGHLHEVGLQQGDMLEEAGRPVDAVYFSQAGMVSLVVQMPEDKAIEVGTIGSEGAVGITAGLGSHISFITAMVQVSGTSLCVSASRFRTAAEQSSHIRDLIVRYADVQLAQLQQTAACNALHETPARLCRWLLQTSDKIASDTIPFTHEFLADMLAVRRSTISEIASAFQDAGIIHTHRGHIKLLKREELEKNACVCYEIIRRHVDRLIPQAK
jgi:CRP-like cAMP-binding protein